MIELPGRRTIPTKLGALSDRIVEVDYLDELKIVVDFYKLFTYQSEPRGSNVWRGLSKFIAMGGGDCEDFAVAGYELLRIIGRSDDHLAIIIGVNAEGINHAILAAMYNDEWYYIDSATMSVISPGSVSFRKFKPAYAINRTETVVFLPEETDNE